MSLERATVVRANDLQAVLVDEAMRTLLDMHLRSLRALLQEVVHRLGPLRKLRGGPLRRTLLALPLLARERVREGLRRGGHPRTSSESLEEHKNALRGTKSHSSKNVLRMSLYPEELSETPMI